MLTDCDPNPFRKFNGKRAPRGMDAETVRGPASPPPELIDCAGDCLGVFERAELRAGLCSDCRQAAR